MILVMPMVPKLALGHRDRPDLTTAGPLPSHGLIEEGENLGPRIAVGKRLFLGAAAKGHHMAHAMPH